LAREWAIDRDRFTCENAGTGLTDSVGKYQGNVNLSSGSISSNEEQTGNVSIYSLDSYLQGNPVTLIKADIEGMELDMLKGARQIIIEQRPKLAICIYHTPWDYFEIPLYIKSLVPEYHLAIRHHYTGLNETVLYAWV
jgi:hypothetical protein